MFHGSKFNFGLERGDNEKREEGETWGREFRLLERGDNEKREEGETWGREFRFGAGRQREEGGGGDLWEGFLWNGEQGGGLLSIGMDEDDVCYAGPLLSCTCLFFVAY